MNWAQIGMIIVLTIGVTAAVFLHGETRRINMWFKVANAAIFLTLLHYGGFWK